MISAYSHGLTIERQLEATHVSTGISIMGNRNGEEMTNLTADETLRAGRRMGRAGRNRASLPSLVVAALGFGMLSQVHGASGLALLVTASVVFSVGLAAVFTLAADMVVGTAPRERAGAASAILETSSELGGALGIAVLGSIGTAVYRSLRDVLAPRGVQ